MKLCEGDSKLENWPLPKLHWLLVNSVWAAADEKFKKSTIPSTYVTVSKFWLKKAVGPSILSISIDKLPSQPSLSRMNIS